MYWDTLGVLRSIEDSQPSVKGKSHTGRSRAPNVTCSKTGTIWLKADFNTFVTIIKGQVNVFCRKEPYIA